MPHWPREYLESDDWVELERHSVTNAGGHFLHQHSCDMQYLTADLHLLQVLKEASEVVDAALSEAGQTPLTPMQNRLGRLKLDEGRAAADRVRGEIALTRYVDNYLTYISDLLREIFNARPEALKSQEQLTVEEVLAFSTLAELTAYVADRKVTRLSFRGLGELTTYFEKQLDMPLVSDVGLRTSMNEWVALRNLLTHRRGVVDARALAGGLSIESYTLGERVHVESNDGFALMAGVVLAVIDLDRRAAAKFGLEQRPFALDESTDDSGEDVPDLGER